MRMRFLMLALATSMLSVIGCAKVPTAEIQAAHQSIEKAKAAEATDYAPEAMRAVHDAQDRLDAELKAQEEQFALFRSYDYAIQLAEEVKQAGEKAQVDAIEGRRQAREEAASLIAQVRTTLDDIKSLLERAPRGKGTEIDLAMLRSDVGEIEGTLTETEGAFSAERFLESKAKAEAALASAIEVQIELNSAMVAKRAARPS